jgi:hypothetical protein
MSLDDLPEVIKQEIKNQTEKDRVSEDNRLYVTELIGCLRKAWFKRKFPKPLALKSRWYFYRGNVWDNLWTPLFEKNQVSVTHRLRSVPVVISGRIDFIDADGAIADLKTTDNLYWINKEGAKEDNKKQVMFYAWCMAKDKARLYYVSLKDAIKVEVEFTEDDLKELVEEMELNATILYNALIDDCPPERDARHIDSYWECKPSKEGEMYCDYAEECKSGKCDCGH